MGSEHPIAATPFGRLVGRRVGDLDVYRGVRFAEPPLGPLRFAPPRERPVSDEVVDASRDGPIAPQTPSRLEAAMGRFDDPQDEDCLFATVWAPADLGRGERVPVLAWLHGGAFTTGAGSLDWYSGARLASRGRMVVVGLNSRLGALGYMRLPGISPGNLGFADQLAGLRWVQRAIGAFGGDPDRVTLMGQSAGAFAALAVVAHPEGRTLVRRAILQSGPFALSNPADEAEDAGRAFARELGVPAERSAFEALPVERLLAASGAVARARSNSPIHAPRPAFQPCIDGELIRRPLIEAAADGACGWCDMLVGATREEMSVFSGLNPRIAGLDEVSTRTRLTEVFGERADEAFAEYAGLRGWSGSAGLVADVMGDLTFVQPAVQLALCQERAGRAAYLYQFDWPSPHPGFGANHCLELPFVFGNPDAWQAAPMIAGADPHEVRHVTDAMQSAWIAFAADGRPAVPGLPWPAYTAAERWTMVFDRYTAPARDPAGAEWRIAFREPRAEAARQATEAAET